MLPPISSNTMSSADLLGGGNKVQKSSPIKEDEEKKAGRPEKEDNQKSDKTIANKESM